MSKAPVADPTLPPLTKLSVVIPAQDEEGCIASTVEHLHLELRLHDVCHEIVVVDDGSKDRTWQILCDLQARVPTLAPVQNTGAHGFGRAVSYGLDNITGDAAVVMMADESDDCRDVVRYWRVLNQGWECVFGSRFVAGGGTIDYPRVKLLLNRLVNLGIRVLFRAPLNDTTNAFKAYRRTVLDGCRPLIAPHFNLTVELPLKAIVRGYTSDRDPDHVAESPDRPGQAEAERNGKPLSIHHSLRLAGKVFQPRGLSEQGTRSTGRKSGFYVNGVTEIDGRTTLVARRDKMPSFHRLDKDFVAECAPCSAAA